jgi:hypothetical protein
MGILISLIVLPVKAIHDRRKKKKAEKIALNYTTTDTSPATQSQSRRPDTQHQPELAYASQQPPELTPEQQQQRVEESNSTLGAARAGYPAPA